MKLRLESEGDHSDGDMSYSNSDKKFRGGGGLLGDSRFPDDAHPAASMKRVIEDLQNVATVAKRDKPDNTPFQADANSLFFKREIKD